MKQAAYLARILILQYFLSAFVWLPIARADDVCVNLPTSSLGMFAIKMDKVEEQIVSEQQFRIIAQSAKDGVRGDVDQLPSRDALILGTSSFITSFYIVHRLIRRDDGTICDSPIEVQLFFGPAQWTLVMPRGLTANQCTRRLVLQLEADQEKAVQNVVAHFITDQASNYYMLMRMLKTIPAPNAELAIQRWNTALTLVVGDARRRLAEDIRSAIAHVYNETPDVRSDACTNDDHQ